MSRERTATNANALCRQRFTLDLTLESPFLSQAPGAPAYGVDSAALRDGADNSGGPIFPGTLLKGVFRGLLKEIAAAAPDHLSPAMVNALFGAASGDRKHHHAVADPSAGIDDPWRPVRAAVRFDDALCKTAVSATIGTLTRIRIDGATGAAEDGMLQVVELPFPLGTPVVFEATVEIVAAPADIDTFKAAMAIACDALTALGAFKSAGFGHVRKAGLRPHDRHPVPIPPAPVPKGAKKWSEAKSVRLLLRFDRPVMVNAEFVGGNLYRSADIIPGGVIKGALAAAAERAGVTAELADDLAAVVCAHAFPATDPSGRATNALTRPQPLPYSIVAARRSKDDWSLHDAALEDVLTLTDAAVISGVINWKRSEPWWPALTTALPLPARPRRQARTRTAIEAGTSVAETSRMFAHITCAPAGIVWVGRLSRGEASGNGFTRLLGLLEAGLPGIGKTKATATVHLAADGAPPHRDDSPDITVVRLLTPAALHDPETVLNGPAAGTDPADWLRATYQRYWDSVFARAGATAPPLREVFGRQDWAGGYLAMRYPPVSGCYLPWLLTRPGTVFVFERREGARRVFEDLVLTGLPAAIAGATWRTCPFVPGNGYGEIALGPALPATDLPRSPAGGDENGGGGDGA